MRSSNLPKLVLVLATVLTPTLTFAQAVPEVPINIRSYPYLVVTPTSPVDGDKVAMQIVLGTASSPCDAPEFTNISFEITQRPEEIFPPNFDVLVRYTMVPPPPDLICPAIYAPTDYGPLCDLGELDVGTYIVHDATIDSSSERVGTFSVARSGESHTFDVSGVVTDGTYPQRDLAGPEVEMPVLGVPGVMVYLQEMQLILPTQTAGGEYDPDYIGRPNYLTIDSTKTNKTGSFTFGSRYVGGQYNLAFSHEKFIPQSKSFFLDADTFFTVTMLRNNASAKVAGTIYGVDCPDIPGVAAPCQLLPLAGCTVSVYPQQILYELTASGADAGLIPDLPGARRTVTDKDGSYSLSVPISRNGESWLVSAAMTGYRAANESVQLYSGAAVAVDLELEKIPATTTSSVRGRVTEYLDPTVDCGATDCLPSPIPGCTVTVTMPYIALEWEAPADPGLLIARPFRAVTDENGEYEITDLYIDPAYAAEQHWVATAWKKGYSREQQAVTVNAGTTVETNFMLHPLYQNTGVNEVDGIVYTVSTDQAAYNLEESIVARYSIVNTTEATRTFDGFSLACEYDLVITTPDGDVVFDTKENAACFFMLSEVEVGPGETVTHDFAPFALSEELLKEHPELAVDPVLTVTTGLRGDEYEFTRVSVPVRLDLNPTPTIRVGSAAIVPAVEYASTTGQLTLSLPRRQLISVRAYTLGGRLLSDLSFEKVLGAGVHSMALTNGNHAGAMQVLHVTGKDVSRTVLLNRARAR